MGPIEKLASNSQTRVKSHTGSGTSHKNTPETSIDRPKGVFKRMPLLNADELVFFNTLSSAIDDTYAIFTKIPLENVIHPSSISEKRFLVFKEIDYLICDKKTSLPICVIDIEPDSEMSEMNYLLNVSGIAVVHLTGDITSEELRKKIRETKPRTNIEFPKAVHDVLVTIIENTGPKLKRRKNYPVISHAIVQKTSVQRYVTYGHWIIWAVFGLFLAYAVFRVFSI